MLLPVGSCAWLKCNGWHEELIDVQLLRHLAQCCVQGVVPVLHDMSGFAPICIGPDIPGSFQELLATCHGLAQLGHELVGDPLDQRLFESTGECLRWPGPCWVGSLGMGPVESKAMPDCTCWFALASNVRVPLGTAIQRLLCPPAVPAGKAGVTYLLYSAMLPRRLAHAG